MHRIDTATARPDVNGPGKPGFSDNSDLDNQDATYLSPSWCNAVQEELSGAVESLGGSLNKADNSQLAKLMLQTFSKKAVVDPALENLVEALNTALGRIENLESNALQTVKVGQIVTFAQHYSTATEVAAFMGFGTWERFAEGRTLVGFSSVPADPEWTRTSGAEFGEYEHQLTEDEGPAHSHDYKDRYFSEDLNRLGAATFREPNNGHNANLGTEGSDTDNNTFLFINDTTEETGESKGHNNVQPSVVVDCWIRTA